MTITNKRSLIALLLSLVLVVSLFTVSIFATESESTSDESVAESVETGSESGSETEVESESKGSSSSNNSTNNSTSTTDKTITETRNTLIINAVIIVCIIAIAAALIIRFRAKLFAFLRSVKSELKKIVWASKENTRKSFIVVAVVALVVAFAIFLMDTAFEKGIAFLTETVSSWR